MRIWFDDFGERRVEMQPRTAVRKSSKEEEEERSGETQVSRPTIARILADWN